MSEFLEIANAAQTMASEPPGPVTRNDLNAVLRLVIQLAREADKLPKTRPVGRPPKCP